MGKSDPLFKARGRGRPAKSKRDEAASRTGFEGSIVPPSRKAVSIFKQPVTLVSTAKKESKVMNEDQIKRKPTKKNDSQVVQMMWAKRLSGLGAMVPVDTADKAAEDIEKAEYIEETLHLAGRLKIAISALDDQATAANLCHSLSNPNHGGCFGQIASLEKLETHFMSNVLPDQPLVEKVSLSDLNDDINAQEKRVLDCRKRLQEVMKHFG